MTPIPFWKDVFRSAMAILVWQIALAVRRRFRLWILVVAMLLVGGGVQAQSTAFDRLTPALPTANERKAADIASWVTAGVAIGLDFKESWKGGKEERLAFVAKVGTVYAITFLIKEIAHRKRPCSPECGVDRSDSSFPSGHTAIAFSTMGGPRMAISVPLAVSTGGLRIAAGKHWLTDTLVGAGVGLLASRIR